jgi:hypothetical protein
MLFQKVRFFGGEYKKIILLRQGGRLYSVEIHAICVARTSNGDYPTNGLSMFLVDGKSPGLTSHLDFR